MALPLLLPAITTGAQILNTVLQNRQRKKDAQAVVEQTAENVAQTQQRIDDLGDLSSDYQGAIDGLIASNVATILPSDTAQGQQVNRDFLLDFINQPIAIDFDVTQPAKIDVPKVNISGEAQTALDISRNAFPTLIGIAKDITAGLTDSRIASNEALAPGFSEALSNAVRNIKDRQEGTISQGARLQTARQAVAGGGNRFVGSDLATNNLFGQQLGITSEQQSQLGDQQALALGSFLNQSVRNVGADQLSAFGALSTGQALNSALQNANLDFRQQSANIANLSQFERDRLQFAVNERAFQTGFDFDFANLARGISAEDIRFNEATRQFDLNFNEGARRFDTRVLEGVRSENLGLAQQSAGIPLQTFNTETGLLRSAQGQELAGTQAINQANQQNRIGTSQAIGSVVGGLQGIADRRRREELLRQADPGATFQIENGELVEIRQARPVTSRNSLSFI